MSENMKTRYVLFEVTGTDERVDEAVRDLLGQCKTVAVVFDTALRRIPGTVFPRYIFKTPHTVLSVNGRIVRDEQAADMYEQAGESMGKTTTTQFIHGEVEI